MPTISIIMPVYNSAKTVGRMVDSLLCQTYSDFELIAVNDGSTDSSLSILRDYACQDSRIVIIDKPNGGVASARQAGMNVMHGKYFIHADSDDWVEPNMLESMLYVAERDCADIIISDYYVIDRNNKITQINQDPGSLDPFDVLYNLHSNKLFGGLCHKLISTKIFFESKASFIAGVNYCEDKLLLTQILATGKPVVSYLNRAFYYYEFNMNSITNKPSIQAYEGMKAFLSTYPLYIPKNQLDRYVNIFEDDRMKLFISAFFNCAFNRFDLKDEFQKVSELLRKRYGLRWNIGFTFINLYLPELSHIFIKM